MGHIWIQLLIKPSQGRVDCRWPLKSEKLREQISGWWKRGREWGEVNLAEVWGPGNSRRFPPLQGPYSNPVTFMVSLYNDLKTSTNGKCWLSFKIIFFTYVDKGSLQRGRTTKTKSGTYPTKKATINLSDYCAHSLNTLNK